MHDHARSRSFRTNRVRVLLMAAAGALTGSTATCAGGYSFVNITDTSGPFVAILPYGGINNAGTVAFAAALDEGGMGLFTGSTAGGGITTIELASGPFTSFGGNAPAIKPPARWRSRPFRIPEARAFTSTAAESPRRCITPVDHSPT